MTGKPCTSESTKRRAGSSAPDPSPVALINQLPIDCLNLVFSFLEVRSLIRCQRVCKDWNLISRDNVAHRQLLSIRLLESGKKRLPKESSFVYYKGNGAEASSAALAGFRSIRVFWMTRGQPVASADVPVIANVLQQNHATLKGMAVATSIFIATADTVFPKLELLCCKHLNSVDLLKFPNLKRLQLEAQADADILSHLPSGFESLWLKFEEDFQEADNKRVDVVRGLTDRLVIDMSSAAEYDVDTGVRNFLINNPQLRILYIRVLRSGMMTDRSVEEIMKHQFLNVANLVIPKSAVTIACVKRLIRFAVVKRMELVAISMPPITVDEWETLFEETETPDKGSIHLRVILLVISDICRLAVTCCR